MVRLSPHIHFLSPFVESLETERTGVKMHVAHR